MDAQQHSTLTGSDDCDDECLAHLCCGGAGHPTAPFISCGLVEVKQLQADQLLHRRAWALVELGHLHECACGRIAVIVV